MSKPVIRRVVCLSSRQPTACPREVLDVCHGYPSRKSQSGLRGKLLAFGEQFALVLEGPTAAIEGLLERVAREAPGAELSVRWQSDADGPTFHSWSIGDLYLDEIAARDPALAEEVGDLVIDLLSPPSEEDAEADPYARLVAILDRRVFAPIYGASVAA
ncbi:MAG: BLUF domain-containing protein [Planctomycetota bacterium]